MSTSDQLVVLVAPPGVLGGIRDTLQDWSALGLVSRFWWVEDPAPSQSGRLAALEIDQGRSRPVRLAEVLATSDPARLRLCVLVPAFAGAAVVEPEIEDAVARLVRSSAGPVPVEALRCLITRPDCGPGRAPVAREGWHNLVVSPEDSRGPGLGHHLLEPTDDPFEVGPPAAATVCGLLGLWSGISEAPLDGRRVPPARVARVVRGYFRRLDAGETSATVREGVLSMTGDLPRPRVGNGQAVTVDDVELATTTMADQLWTKHREVLGGARQNRPVEVARQIGAWEALKLLLGFLAATIKNAPMAWYSKVVREVSSGAASSIHSMVFGQSPSAYQVVVNGRRPDGYPAGWQDLSAASAAIGDSMDTGQQRQVHAAHTDLSRVWRDYVHAAFTLADAGDRSPQLPPVAVNVDRGVVVSAHDCAPGPDSDFTAMPDLLAPTPDQSRLQAADVLGLRNAQDRLRQARTDPSAGLDADRTLRAVEAWAATHQHSFAVRSGTRLAEAITNLHTEVKDLLAALKAAGEASKPSDELARKQRRLAMVMRGLLIGLVVVIAVLVVLGAVDVLEWKVVAIGSGAAFLIWLGASFTTFLRRQRNLFAELHRLREADSIASVSRANLSSALSDLRRTTAAYGQHLAWSRVLGVVLQRPFGDQGGPPQLPVLDEQGLPLGMRLGTARPDAAAVSNTTAQLRRRQYGEGWLTKPWEQIIAEAPSRLGVDGIDLADKPERLYGERAGEGTVLARWVRLVETAGTGSASGDVVWREVLADLSGSGHADALLQQVSVGRDSAIQTRDAFMAGVDQERAGRVDIFDGYLFTPAARAQQRNAVADTWTRTATDGLSRVAVTVQLSEALPAYELSGLQDAEPDADPQLPDLPFEF